MEIVWIDTQGGPLICAGVQRRAKWKGTVGSSVGVEQSDYERACAVSDYLGVIACGTSSVLVLGDEPLSSSFAMRAQEVLIVRWIACDSHEVAVEALARMPPVLDELEAPKPFRLEGSRLVMFDAALDEFDVLPNVSTALPVGEYSVTTEIYREKKLFEFLVHRFVQISSA